mmetsp:Transcript_931/g.2424  ORF Transcript_931/g.2424 Transcript_931/m.2424 type:complete len:211 (+) Transcript_931:199-831(+)
MAKVEYPSSHATWLIMVGVFHLVSLVLLYVYMLKRRVDWLRAMLHPVLGDGLVRQFSRNPVLQYGVLVLWCALLAYLLSKACAVWKEDRSSLMPTLYQGALISVILFETSYLAYSIRSPTYFSLENIHSLCLLTVSCDLMLHIWQFLFVLNTTSTAMILVIFLLAGLASFMVYHVGSVRTRWRRENKKGSYVDFGRDVYRSILSFFDDIV